MKIKNKKTGYIFEISDKEGEKLLVENEEEFESLDKKYVVKTKKPKTVREKVVVSSKVYDCLNALKKEQIIQELNELDVKYNPKMKKKELIEILKKAGGC